jgi:hypothetical protein
MFYALFVVLMIAFPLRLVSTLNTKLRMKNLWRFNVDGVALCTLTRVQIQRGSGLHIPRTTTRFSSTKVILESFTKFVSV